MIPGLARDTLQAAFENSSKIIKNLLVTLMIRPKFRSPEVIKGKISSILRNLNIFFFLSDALACEPKELERRIKKENDCPFPVLFVMCRQS